MASSSAHFFLASSIAFMSRLSAGVRTSGSPLTLAGSIP